MWSGCNIRITNICSPPSSIIVNLLLWIYVICILSILGTMIYDIVNDLKDHKISGIQMTERVLLTIFILLWILLL